MRDFKDLGVLLGSSFPRFGDTWVDGTYIYFFFTHYIGGHIRHGGLITLFNWFPSKHHIDGTGIHQPGDAPLLTH